MRKETGTLPSSDGTHTLHWFACLPDGEARAAMLIVHGMAEYKERYEKTASDLAEAGIACYCYDQLGHGETRVDESENGYFGEKDGVKYILDDVHGMAGMIRSLYPGLKLILLGHSMGSFIVRYYTAEFADIDALVVSGTSGGNPGCGPGILMSKISAKIHGPKYVDKFIDKIAMGGNSAKFKDEEYPAQAWLSRDIAIRKDMSVKSFPFSVTGMKDMFEMLRYVSDKKWYEKYPKQIPVYLFSGSDDPIGDYGVGFMKVVNGLKSAGADVKYKLYKDGRHEMLNEINRDEVVSDLVKYIESVL
ncbi:MAG: alpha/beta fold hydrolase [Clostridia bacterium]|nr:alpha/beta fold hydrolase [Clostridia bacterium]